jgi:hypothetical protein
MSPYEILGIRPSATLAAAEAAYRARLRESHPDVHAHAGPDAVAWAEQRTRELNDAIRDIRRLHAEPAFTPNADDDWFARDHGFTTSDDTDWFGNPTRPRWTVQCALCGLPVDDQREYRVHLVLDHAFAERLAKQRRRAARPPLLTLIPAPMFWALMTLMVYWGVLFSVFGDSAIALAGWWLGIFAFLIFLPFAYRAGRYRRRF